MCHDEVKVVDAIYAVLLLNSCAESSCSGSEDNNPLHATFPEDAAQEYMDNCECILSQLGLDDVWKREREDMESRNQLVGVNFDDLFAEEMDFESAQANQGINQMIVTQVIPQLKSRNLNYEENEPVMKNKKKQSTKKEAAAKRSLQESSSPDGKENESESKKCCLRSMSSDMEEDFGKPLLAAVTSTQTSNKVQNEEYLNEEADTCLLDPVNLNDKELQDGNHIGKSEKINVSHNVSTDKLSSKQSKLSSKTLSILKQFEASQPPSKKINPQSPVNPIFSQLKTCFSQDDEEDVEF